GSFDAIAGRLPGAPQGEAAALVGTALRLLVWTVGASIVQVAVYRQGLRAWTARSGEAAERAPTEAEADDADALPPSPRFAPRAVAIAAAVAFTLLIVDLSWPLLAAISAFLAVAWLTA